MTENSYRIRTNVGEEPSVINVKLNQTYDTLEILSLKLSQEDTYKLYKSSYGVIVGRVLANGGVGIPNAKVSVFVEADSEQSFEDNLKYPFSSVSDKDRSGIRYNLLPNSVDDACYQNVGTFPNKRLVLDNNDVIEVFEKYYKYTTCTNQSGDYMISNIPTGAQQIHVDVDLSDIGFLSQRPRDMMYKGYTADLFESPNKFKQDTNLDSLPQIYSQNVGVYVFPFWGDTTQDDTIAITRCDIQMQYKFEPTCVFMGSVVADNDGHIGKDCTPSKGAGTMRDLIASQGRIEMIRKTSDGRVEEFAIKGNRLIDENGVWCYQIPMNLDYVTTDEFGNLVPTDNPSKGIPTRTSVRFRVTLDDEIGNNSSYKRCSYLIPNNPRIDEDYVDFSETKLVDYEFGSNTRDEDYRDLFWNKVYSVKSFIPRLQTNLSKSEKKYSGIKKVNHGGNNNRFPYNGLYIKLSMTYRLICVLMKFIIYMVAFINNLITVISEPFCRLCEWLTDLIYTLKHDLCIKVWKWKICPLRPLAALLELPKTLACLIKIDCIRLGAEFCDDGQNRLIFLPGCHWCTWDRMQKEHTRTKDYRDGWVLNNEPQSLLEMFGAAGGEDNIPLMTCVENALAQENECTSYNFYNDWINGVLYFPKWYRHITPKKKFFFGLFKKKAKDQWCSAEKGCDTSYVQHCAVTPTPSSNECGDNCHKSMSSHLIKKGIVVAKETMLGHTVYYYKSVQFDPALNDGNGEVMLMFPTDIILLGSLNENDVDGVPQFFKHLPITTYQIPNDILDINTDVITTLNPDGTVTVTTDTDVEASGQDWGNSNPELCGKSTDGDGGLFYGIGCSQIDMKVKSCINLRRICELGVSLDATKELANSAMTKEESVDDYKRLVSDGFVSYDEIYGNEMRAMFATMNNNRLKTELNPLTGYQQYLFKYLYPTNFDGALSTVMRERQRRCSTNISYKENFNLEIKSNDYLEFRMGEKPFYYDDNKKMPRYENSFYFYFGLKPGATALEKFNSLFFASCENVSEITNKYGVLFDANTWCNDMSDDQDAYKKRDGFLRLNLTGVTTPYSLEFVHEDGDTLTFTEQYDERVYLGNLTSDLISNGSITIAEGEERDKKLDTYNNIQFTKEKTKLFDKKGNKLRITTQFYYNTDEGKIICDKDGYVFLPITPIINEDGLVDKYCYTQENVNNAYPSINIDEDIYCDMFGKIVNGQIIEGLQQSDDGRIYDLKNNAKYTKENDKFVEYFYKIYESESGIGDFNGNSISQEIYKIDCDEDGYVLNEENASYPLKNGKWEMTITDASGNVETIDINYKPDILTCEVVFDEFNINSNEIYDENISQGRTSIPFSPKDYMSVANNVDKFKLNTNTNLYDRDLGGVIKIRNIFNQKTALGEDDVIIKVTSVNKIITNDNKIVLDSQYKDEFTEFYCENASIDNSGKLQTHKMQKGYLGFKEGVFYFGVPLPLQYYKIEITQLCKSETVVTRPNGDTITKTTYKTTNNTFTSTVYIKEPSPYKFFINDIDYEIIKGFKSGWEIKDLNNQDNNIKNIINIKGWTELSKFEPKLLVEEWINESKTFDDFYNCIIKYLKKGYEQTDLCPYRWTDEYCYDIDKIESFVDDVVFKYQKQDTSSQDNFSWDKITSTPYQWLNSRVSDIRKGSTLVYDYEMIINNEGNEDKTKIYKETKYKDDNNITYNLYMYSDGELCDSEGYVFAVDGITNDIYKLYTADGTTQLEVKGDETSGYFYEVNNNNILCDVNGFVYALNEKDEKYTLIIDSNNDGIYEYNDGTLCDKNGYLYDTSMTINEKMLGYCDEFKGIVEDINSVIEKRKDFVLSMKENFYITENAYSQTLKLSSTTTSLPVTYKIAYHSEIENEETEVISLESNKYKVVDESSVELYLPTITSNNNQTCFYYENGKGFKQPYLVGVKNARDIIIPYGTILTDFNGNTNALGENLFHVHFLDKVFYVTFFGLSGFKDNFLIHDNAMSITYGEGVNKKDVISNKFSLDGMICDGVVYNGLLSDEPQGSSRNNTHFVEQTIADIDIDIKTDSSTYDEDTIPTVRQITQYSNGKKPKGIINNNLDTYPNGGLLIPPKDCDMVIADSNKTVREFIYSQMSFKLENTSVNYANKSKNIIEYSMENGDNYEEVYVIKCTTNFSNYPFNKINVNKGEDDDIITVANPISQDVINRLIQGRDTSIEVLDTDGETVLGKHDKVIGSSYGIFRKFETNKKYFFIAKTSNNCYAISPIYDFSLSDLKLQLIQLERNDTKLAYMLMTKKVQNSCTPYIKNYNYTITGKNLFDVTTEQSNTIQMPEYAEDGTTYYIYTDCDFNGGDTGHYLYTHLRDLDSEGSNKIKIVDNRKYVWVSDGDIFDILKKLFNNTEDGWLKNYRRNKCWLQYKDISGLSHRRNGLVLGYTSNVNILYTLI